jgi:hypothetical protein
MDGARGARNKVEFGRLLDRDLAVNKVCALL